ncbi:MAG: GNAT family N-acetyltransferase [Clostridia bacterium]
MKNETEREFIRCGRRRQCMLADELIKLRPREYDAIVKQLGNGKSFVFDIVDVRLSKTIGEIALRVGESASLFYLGHVGYHIDAPFRGRHAALHACRLCLPIFRALGMRSFVITTDEDNAASIRTCEQLGCVLESTVAVPLWCREEFQISARKRRYVCEIPDG